MFFVNREGQVGGEIVGGRFGQNDCEIEGAFNFWRNKEGTYQNYHLELAEEALACFGA